MARFRLTKDHYLNVPGTEWEQVELSATGKQVRHRYNVHRYLAVENGDDQTPPKSGEIIVSTKDDPRYPYDIVFIGDPSNEMEPLDAEAEEMVRAVRSRPHPIEGLPNTNAVIQAYPQPSAPDPMAEVKRMMAELAAQNSLLQAQLAEMQLRQQEAKESEEDDSAGDIPAPKLSGISLSQ